jgi:hypothetical protein
MQVVRVEFVVHCENAQEAVDAVELLLPNLRARNISWMESWNVYSVEESVTHMVSHPVEDGKVIKNV